MRFWKSPAAPRHSSFRSRLLEHRILLLLLDLLETLLLLQGLLLFQTLLRLFLHFPPLLRLRLVALHAFLREGLIADETAVHAPLRHLPGTACLLDTIAMGLVDLVIVGVILRFCHDGPTKLANSGTEAS